jgi:hypothetical protein
MMQIAIKILEKKPKREAIGLLTDGSEKATDLEVDDQNDEAQYSGWGAE